MNEATLQAKIYAGYASAALRIGSTVSVYRPSVSETPAANPISSGNVVASILAAFNAEDMTFTKPRAYGKATWYCVADGTQTEVGDYLVGSAGTFFVAAMQPLLPILTVLCNRTVNVFRPQTQTSAGVNPYGGTTFANQVELMTQFPASILKGGKGEKEGAVLPGDVRLPSWIILMPAIEGVMFLVADIVTDDLGRQYVISSPELTELGWRLEALQAQT